MQGLLSTTGLPHLAVGAMLVGLLATPGIAVGQSLKDQIVGTWRLAAIYNDDQGVKRHSFGEKPVGLFVFDRSGNVGQFLSRSDLPSLAVPNRLKGTDKENREVVQGTVSGFGTYAVDGDTVTIKWGASSYLNRTATTEKRVHKIVGDEMSVVDRTASSGGTAHANFVRAERTI